MLEATHSDSTRALINVSEWLLRGLLFSFVLVVSFTLPNLCLAQGEGQVFSGTSPPIVNSFATLSLKEDLVNQKVFSWESYDSVLGNISTGFIPSGTWNLSGSNPTRLVFTGGGGGATFSGNVLFEPYNRAILDVVKGGKRLRYLLALQLIDLDIDSDNTNGIKSPDESGVEEFLEDKIDVPGKIINENVGNINLNQSLESGAVPNWADGIDKEYPAQNGLAAVNNNNNGASPNFVPMIMKIGKSVDTSRAKFRFIYDASNPDNLDRIVNARPAADYVYPFVVSYTLPAAGRTRVWTKDGPSVRKAKGIHDVTSGDYVQSSVTIEAAKLGLSATANRVQLYVECVRKSTAMGDIIIKVELDPTGSGTYTVSDQVRATCANLSFEAHPTSNKYGFDSTDQGVVDLRRLVENRDLHTNAHNGDNFPQPSIPDNPTVKAQQVSVGYEVGATGAKHGTKTKIRVLTSPNAISPSLFRFKSMQPAMVTVDSQATDAGGGVWEIELEGRDRYEVKDNELIFTYLASDTTAPDTDKYIFKRLSAYSFKEAKLDYDYYRVEDMRPTYTSGGMRDTAVSRKTTTTLSADTDGTNIIKVQSVADFVVGDCLLFGTSQLGKISAINGAKNEISIESNIPAPPAGPSATAGVYTITLGSSEFSENDRNVDRVLRQGVAAFKLGLSSCEAKDIPYDRWREDSLLEDPDTTKPDTLVEEQKILDDLGRTRASKIIVRVRGISGDTTGYAYPGGGAIFISDNGNEYTVAHEGLHAKSLRHDRDRMDNVMWWLFGVKPKLDNTPTRASGNYNICETSGGNQKIETQWSNISR